MVALVGSASADPGPGVTRSLAALRRATIHDLSYDVALVVPADSTPVTGTVRIHFRLSQPRAVVLDFRAPAANVRAVEANGQSVPPMLSPDHITIPGRSVRAGDNVVEVSFVATDAALNRRGDYLYALFVPDRASTAFPCFDQPDLKARFRLTLTVPTQWRAVANGSVLARDSGAVHAAVRFRETAPISTYLFSFAAGRLDVETAERDGRRFTLYHRETDTAKIARNRDAIFDLHAASIRWLEAYTGIPYPFEKFDFFAIPAFQFGGMEHPGAVWYNASALFLDQAATRNQFLGRANVIAHETAHMWFGDLVTMAWFNDVWMKEVFANFMAAKIVGPSFPDINHELRFYLGHHPSAYATDRTLGTNPIRQPLENLRDAGSLYGAIIYQKAPIVMRQLERTIGETTMRDGLREYLDRHRFGNATWTELVTILDRKTPDDLRRWSRIWVEEPGRPIVTARYLAGTQSLRVSQRDPRHRGLVWPQRLGVTLGTADSVWTLPVTLRSTATTVRLRAAPRFVLAGTDGVGYGRFPLDPASRETLLTALPALTDPVVRSAGWQTLFEEMIDGTLEPDRLLHSALGALPTEVDDLISQELLGLIQTTYWRYLSPEARLARAAEVERVLWAELDRAATPSRKGSFFAALVGVTQSRPGLDRLTRIWRKEETPTGLPLEEPQYTSLAEALALREIAGAETILDQQEGRISNPDRRARFRFVRPSLSANPSVRDSVFASFRTAENRRRESWVLDAMHYLNHPLRATAALTYLGPSLALIPEIKRTGDIFFPLAWVSAALDGHQSKAAADTVTAFLDRHPSLDRRLRGKVLQATDGLLRAAAVVEDWRPASTPRRANP